MTTEDILKRIDELIGLGNAVLATKTPETKFSSSHVDDGKFRGFRSASLSFMERIFGASQTYYKEFIEHVTNNWPTHVEVGINILRAAKAEIEGGWLFTVEGQVSAEIFADFIALAKEALDDNKDVAAVLACAALEDALKRVAIKENLDVDDKDMSEVINALKAKGVIKGAQVPIVQSYVKLRNKAFHAEWDKFDKESVSSVIGFTEQFLLTNFS
jgi:uncharacterized protein YutE (UPF0331/DUF86 family)